MVTFGAGAVNFLSSRGTQEARLEKKLTAPAPKVHILIQNDQNFQKKKCIFQLFSRNPTVSWVWLKIKKNQETIWFREKIWFCTLSKGGWRHFFPPSGSGGFLFRSYFYSFFTKYVQNYTYSSGIVKLRHPKKWQKYRQKTIPLSRVFDGKVRKIAIQNTPH